MAPSISNPNSAANCSPSLFCKHSPSATLEILILIVVLFSCTFLITSYFNYIFQSLSLLLSTVVLHHIGDLLNEYHVVYSIGLISFSFVFVFLAFEVWCAFRPRKCSKSRCKGLRNAMEFDLQLQTDECLRSGVKAVREMDRLPWKGGDESNPDYERFRAELRRMAPPNGRAVLLFRSKCGCPVAKLEGWGSNSKRPTTRRSKK